MTNNFLVYCPLKEGFRDIFVIRCPGQKNRFRAHNLAAVGVEEIVRLGGEFSPPPEKTSLE